MASGKTIDNLGDDAYRHYATTHIEEDVVFEEARIVSGQAQKDRNTPVYHSQLSLVLETELKNRPFGDVETPQGFESMTQKAFLHQFIPSLGSNEKVEASIHRIQKYIASLQTTLDASKNAADGNKIENQIIEAQNILELLELIFDMSKLKGDIEGNRRRNQKG